jgi:hypothetical protein
VQVAQGMHALHAVDFFFPISVMLPCKLQLQQFDNQTKHLSNFSEIRKIDRQQFGKPT